MRPHKNTKSNRCKPLLIGVVIGPVYACAGIFFPALQEASHQAANFPGEMNSLSPFTALGMRITTALGVNAFMCVFGFALYALADQNAGILDSFAISARITAGNRIRWFFVMVLAAIPIVVLDLLLVLLGESLQASESEAASLYLLLIGLVFWFLFIIPWLMSVHVCAYMMLSGQLLVSKLPQKGGDSLSGEAIPKKQ